MTIKTMDCFLFLFLSSFFLATEEGLFSNRNIEQICIKMYIFCFIFSLLLHRLAVRITLAFHISLQVVIELIQVYNWEIRHHHALIGLSLWTC